MQVCGTGNPQYLIGSQKTSNVLKKTDRQLRKILEQLSTAQRINRAADDAAGLGISEQLRSNIRGFKMASRNVQDAIAALNIAEGSANRIGDILQRQRELAIASRNGTLTDADRQAMDAEYQALNQEIDRLAQGTKYNTQNTSNGTGLGSGTAVIQAGADAGEMINLPKIDFTVTASGLAGTSIATSSDAATAFTAISAALQSLNEQRSTIGAMINRFESTVNNLSVAMVNTQAAESVLRDQDIAEGIAEMTRQQLLREGALTAFRRFNALNRSYIMGILE